MSFVYNILVTTITLILINQLYIFFSQPLPPLLRLYLLPGGHDNINLNMKFFFLITTPPLPLFLYLLPGRHDGLHYDNSDVHEQGTE